MTFLALALALVAPGQSPAPATEPELAANPLYRAVLAEGLVVDGVTVKLPPPILSEGMTEDERRAALKKTVDGPLDEFLKDSVNAPFKLKLRDVPYPGGLIRGVDLWFAIHARLDEVDLDELDRKKDQGGQGEVGNMSFSGRTLTDDELKAHGKTSSGKLDRYAFSQGGLLDKIKFSTVNRVVASKSGESWVVASMTDPAFQEGELSNRWVPLPGPGDAKKDLGPPRPYAGSIAYSRVVPLSEKPSVLLVESHVAFVEPKGWFNGTAILKSKISLVAQDQIRQLRREIAKRRKEGKAPAAKS